MWVTIVFAYGADWTGLYVDGNLVFEHHNVEFEQLQRYLPIERLDVRYLDEDRERILSERGHFAGWADTLLDLDEALVVK